MANILIRHVDDVEAYEIVEWIGEELGLLADVVEDGDFV